MLKAIGMATFLAGLALLGCRKPEQSRSADDKAPPASSATSLPAVPSLKVADGSAGVVLQQIADSAEPEVQLEACGELLDKKVSIHATQRTTVAVLMATLITELGAPATVDGNRWTLFCADAPGLGRLFRKGQPPQVVTVPKAPPRLK